MPKAEPKPIRIAPSLLSCDFSQIAEEIRRVEDGGADWLHVDVMDAHFVPNLTIGPPVVAAMKKTARKPLDVHLMITDPDQYAQAFVQAGAASCTFHVEAVPQVERAMQLIDKFHKLGVKVGITLNPDTSVNTLRPYLEHVDLILLMSVFPGFGGQKFIPQVLSKAETLRKQWGYEGDLEIDGGINEQTIACAAAAGCNVFVAGSAIFSKPDVQAQIAKLRQLASAQSVRL